MAAIQTIKTKAKSYHFSFLMFYGNLNINKALETVFLNILERELEKNSQEYHPLPKKEIYLCMIYCTDAIITLQAYPLYVGISNYISNHTQHEQLYILLSMH